MGTAQRLVRNICLHCKVQYKPDYEEIKALGLDSYIQPEQSLWKGRGCDHCRQTGYYGRTGIFEILPYDTEVKDAIRKNIDLGDLREMVRKILTSISAQSLSSRSRSKTVND